MGGIAETSMHVYVATRKQREYLTNYTHAHIANQLTTFAYSRKDDLLHKTEPIEDLSSNKFNY